jgi:hypothetical protein
MAEALEDIVQRAMRWAPTERAVADLEDAVVRLRLLRRRLEHARDAWQLGLHVDCGRTLAGCLVLMGDEEER